MSSRIPKATTIKTSGIWTGRKNIGAVFVRKHNLEANLEVVECETKEITELTAKDWLFLIEGFKKYHSIENLFLDDFIGKLDIKAEDPVIKPFSNEVARRASIEKVTGALSVLTMDYLDFIAEDQIKQLDRETLEVVFNQSLDAVAKAFDVSPKILKREFFRLKWRDQEKLGRQLIFLSTKRKQLISESNSQSKLSLAEILKENRHPNLFIMSGIEHATIFTQ